MKRLFLSAVFILTNNYCGVTQIYLGQKILQNPQIERMELLDSVYSKVPILKNYPDSFWIAHVEWRPEEKDIYYLFDDPKDVQKLTNLFAHHLIGWLSLQKNGLIIDESKRIPVIEYVSDKTPVKRCPLEEGWQPV